MSLNILSRKAASLTLPFALSVLLTSTVHADYTFAPALAVAQPESVALLDVAKCGDRLIAAGERGVVVYSDDDGALWQQAEVPASQTVSAVYCPEPQQVFAAGHGGTILSSSDGGKTWALKLDGNEANQQWLAFAKAEKERLGAALATAVPEEAADLEYALEDAEYAIEDAETAIEAGPVDPLLDIWFSDAQQGIAVGAYGMIYRTSDGGQSWQLAAAGIENPDRYHYYALAQAQSGDLILSGEAGLLYRSQDGGVQWERLDIGYDGTLFGVVVADDGTIVVFGLRGTVMFSEDGGDTWLAAQIRDDRRLGLYGGTRLDDGTLALVGAGGVLLTSRDNGRSFDSTTLSARTTLSSIQGASIADALAVGMTGVTGLEETSE